MVHFISFFGCTMRRVGSSFPYQGLNLCPLHWERRVLTTGRPGISPRLLFFKNIFWGASLVAQWLRIHLPMQGTQVRALVREDPTCRGATKPVRHNYWACALGPVCHSCWSPCAWSPCSATRETTAMRSPHTATKSSPRSPQLEKACAQQWRLNAAKINSLKQKKFFFKGEGRGVLESKQGEKRAPG